MSLTIKKIDTRYTSDREGKQSEVFTYDVVDNGSWVEASVAAQATGIPRMGDEHPVNASMFVSGISATHFRGQPDHIRVTVTYSTPDEGNQAESGGGGGGGSPNDYFPTDEPFLIEWTPNITRLLLKEDLAGNPIVNPNGEPYEFYAPRVRLDGVCKWNQLDWDQSEADKWQNVINSKVWDIDGYKFKKETVLLSYVVGNARYFVDSEGVRTRYYEMTAGISINNDGWVDDAGLTLIRRTGSFYFDTINGGERLPKDSFSASVSFDLNSDGTLLSGDSKEATVENPQYDEFLLFKSIDFNFVDLDR